MFLGFFTVSCLYLSSMVCISSTKLAWSKPALRQLMLLERTQPRPPLGVADERFSMRAHMLSPS
jgi:hypothetical protein